MRTSRWDVDVFGIPEIPPSPLKLKESIHIQESFLSGRHQCRKTVILPLPLALFWQAHRPLNGSCNNWIEKEEEGERIFQLKTHFALDSLKA